MKMIKYVDNMFPHWKVKSMPQTYVAYPGYPTYKYEAQHKPSEGANTDDNYRSQLMEEYVINVFIRFGDNNNEPMFVFPNFKFHELVTRMEKYKIIKLPSAHKDSTSVKEHRETDILIVHKKYGIIIVEVKCSENKYDHAQNQCRKTVHLLYDNDNKILSQYFRLNPDQKKFVVKKVIACPNNDSEMSNNNGYISLYKEDIATYVSFSKWWRKNIATSNEYCESVYYDLVPKLFCKCVSGKDTQPYKQPGNMDTIQKWLHTQYSLQCQVEKEVKNATSSVKKAKFELKKAETGIEKAESESVMNTPDQLQNIQTHIKNAKKQISEVESQICRVKKRIIPTNRIAEGGSTHLRDDPHKPDETEINIQVLQLQLKEVQTLIKNAEKQVKSQIFNVEEKIIPTDHGIITEDRSTLCKLWKYFTFEQSEVWKGKQQVIYGPYGSGKTVLIQCKAADLANFGGKVLIILPTDELIIKYKMFLSEVMFYGNDTIVEIEWFDKIASKEMNSSQRIEKVNTWGRSHRKILLVTLKTFSEQLDLFKALAKDSHVFVDEFLWLESSDIKNYSEIACFLSSLFNKSNENYVWIVPNLYLILTCALTEQQITIERFGLQRFDIEAHLKILSTTLRTTKQIHDFMAQKEWQNALKCISENRNHQLFTIYIDIFISLLCNSHGHRISGPPVRVLNIGNINTSNDDFSKFAAEVIKIEVQKSCKVHGIKPRDVAVVVDKEFENTSCHDNNSYLKYDLLNDPKLNQSMDYTFVSIIDPNYKKPNNKIVVVCDSSEIPSFEWSVVIHVVPSYKKLSFYEGDKCLIASRCKVQYIIICLNGAEDAWPHMNSFQNFKTWCEKNNKKLNVEALYDYLKTEC